jgi:hypothetical protein
MDLTPLLMAGGVSALATGFEHKVGNLSGGMLG